MGKKVFTVCVLVDSDADNIVDAWAEPFADSRSAEGYAQEQKDNLLDEFFGGLKEGHDYELVEQDGYLLKISIRDKYDSRFCYVTITEKEIEI